MANLSNQINQEAFYAYGIGDISGATKSLKTAQGAVANYTLSGVISASGSIYRSVQGTAGGAAFTHIYSNIKMVEYYYDVATDGGAVGNVALRGPQLPATARVFAGFWEPTTAFASGGAAQISLGTSTGAATNLLGAAILATNGTTGIKALVPVFSAATTVSLSATGTPVIGITVAALTNGAGKVTLFYVTAEADTSSVA